MVGGGGRLTVMPLPGGNIITMPPHTANLQTEGVGEMNCRLLGSIHATPFINKTYFN